MVTKTTESNTSTQLTHTTQGRYGKCRGWVVEKITIKKSDPVYISIAKATAQATIILTACLLAIPTLGISLYALYDLWREKSRFLSLNQNQLPSMGAEEARQSNQLEQNANPNANSATVALCNENEQLKRAQEERAVIINRQQQEIATLRNNINTLSYEQHKTSEQKNFTENTLRNKEQEIHRLNNLLNTKNQEIFTLKQNESAKKPAQNSVLELENENQVLKNKIYTLENQLKIDNDAKLKDHLKIEEKGNKIRTLEIEKNQLTESFNHANEEIAELKEELKKIQNTTSHTPAHDSASSEATIKSLEEKLKAEKSYYNKKLDDFERQIGIMRSDYAVKKMNYNSLYGQCDTLRRENGTLKMQIQLQEKIIEELKTALNAKDEGNLDS